MAPFLATLGKIGSGLVKGIGAATGLFGPAVTSGYEKRRDERQFAHQKEMAEYAYSKDLEQWERANAYNAPTQQMARLREAGLNPAMIYGTGGAKTVAAVSPKYQAPRPDYRYSPPIDPTQVLSSYMSLQRHNAEMNILQSRARQEEAAADYARDYQYGRGKYMRAKGVSQMGKTHWEVGTDDRGKTNIFKKLDYQNDYLRQRNDLQRLQIEYYLLNSLGGTAVSAGRLLTGGISRLLKAGKTARGIQKISRYRPQNDRSWSQFKRLDTSTGEIF